MSLVNRNEMTIEKRFYLICLNINGQIEYVKCAEKAENAEIFNRPNIT